MLYIISDKLELSIFEKSINLSNETKILEIPNKVLKSIDFTKNKNYSYTYNGYESKFILDFFGKVEGYYLNFDGNLIIQILKNGNIMCSEICYIKAGEKLSEYNFKIKHVFDMSPNDTIEIKIFNFKNNQHYYFIESYLRINNI
jgi:hypothetical protein